MRFESNLCHISDNKVIVRVQGWIEKISAGSALAEASTVEEAEDKAISRLKQRVINKKSDQNSFNKNKEIKITNHIKVQDENDNKKNESNLVELDQNDWSNELTEIDNEVKRLKWTREDEISFLKENLGYNDRNRITDFNEIIKYLKILKGLNINNNIKNDNTIDLLITESDIILKNLSWDNNKGREFLIKEFNVSTRKELSQKQMISFVNKLKLISNQQSTK
tara:strand:+ start:146 stop:814 length:669 start_codon:yes stop_codon:yes gene_type:complete